MASTSGKNDGSLTRRTVVLPVDVRESGARISSPEVMAAMRGNAQRYRATAVAAGALVLVALWGSLATAQTVRKFVVRLSIVPITVAMQGTVSGRGSADAVLSGSTLTIGGMFEGLQSPATVARLHLAPPGVRGPAVIDLSVSPSTSGTISGTAELTPRQVQALEKNSLYIQIHSEKAPDGNLWGWLFPPEVTR